MVETSLLLWARMDAGSWGRKFAFSWWERREVFMFFCGAQIRTAQSGQWQRSELQDRQRCGDMSHWLNQSQLRGSCGSLACLGFFSSFQFITKRNLPVSLTKSNLGGEGVFLSFNDLSFFLSLHCSETWTPDQHWLRRAASYFPTCHLLFCVPLLASFREILDKEHRGEWTLVHLIAEVSRIQHTWF